MHCFGLVGSSFAFQLGVLLMEAPGILVYGQQVNRHAHLRRRQAVGDMRHSQ